MRGLSAEPVDSGYELMAPFANFAISAAIDHALLAKLLLVEARLLQFPTFASVLAGPNSIAL
jgi:hypothetical protein